jgi:hypothetical protein
VKIERHRRSDLNPRSGCQHKAWGEAKRNPRKPPEKISEARGAADSRIITIDVCNRTAIGRFAGSMFLFVLGPGVSLRSTPGFMLAAASRAKNQALC